MKYSAVLSRNLSIVQLPSVSFLLRKHKISPEALAGILGTGPKNRILKGDILNFLKNPTGSVENIESEAFYSVDVDVTNALKLTSSKWGLSEILASAALKLNLTAKGLNIGTPLVHFTRNTRSSTFNASFEFRNSKDVQSLIELKESDANPDTGCFRFIDSLKLGLSANYECSHLGNGEAAVLTVSELDPINVDDDILDTFTTQKPLPSLPQHRIKDGDLIESLMVFDNVPRLVRFDLTVDSRLASRKAAEKYLEALKNFVENDSERILDI